MNEHQKLLWFRKYECINYNTIIFNHYVKALHSTDIHIQKEFTLIKYYVRWRSRIGIDSELAFNI